MAINENGYLRGQIGNLVNRKVGHQNIVQTKAGHKIRQSPRTKAAATDFGVASTAGGLIRRAFTLCHQQLHDNKMHNRLVLQMQRVMRARGNQPLGGGSIRDGNIKRLINFQFNENCHLEDYVFFDPFMTMDEHKKLTVSIPAIHPRNNFHIPLRCSHISLKIDVIGFHFPNKRHTHIGTEELEMSLYQSPVHHGELSFLFDCDRPDIEAVLVAFSVLYISEEGSRTYLHNSEKLHPAGIIGAFDV